MTKESWETMGFCVTGMVHTLFTMALTEEIPSDRKSITEEFNRRMKAASRNMMGPGLSLFTRDKKMSQVEAEDRMAKLDLLMTQLGLKLIDTVFDFLEKETHEREGI